MKGEQQQQNDVVQITINKNCQSNKERRYELKYIGLV